MIDPITITGGLVADVEHRFTPSGKAVANFRVAQSDSKKNDAGEWETYQSLYLPVNIWDDNPEWKKNPVPWAEMAATLTKGQRVAVRGKLITRTWETKDGSTRSQIEMQADSFYVIPDQPATSSGGGWGGGNNQAPQQQQHQGATWGKPAPTGQGTADEPPF